MTTDWVTWGEVEVSDDQNVSRFAVKNALQPHNPRRAVLTPILLCSNHSGCNAFVTPTGLSSSPAHVEGSATGSSTEVHERDAQPAPNEAATSGACRTSDHEVSPSTDWVLMGWAEGDENDALGANAARDALLPHAPRRCLVRPVVLSSNNAGCTHFVTNGLCSKPMSSEDVLWMEKVAGLAKGTLFKAFSDSRKASESPTEHPWEPMRRYASMARALKEPRGSKSAAHQHELRRSDPLISLHAWHDWHELHAKVNATRAARVHQQAHIMRALRAHAQLTATSATTAARPNTAPTGKAGEALRLQGSTNSLKRKMHLGRLETVDSTWGKMHDQRGERVSSDSVMAFLDEGPEGGMMMSPPARKGGAAMFESDGRDSPNSPDSIFTEEAHLPTKEHAAKKGRAATKGSVSVPLPPFAYGSWAHVVRPDAVQHSIESYSEA